MKLIAVSDTHGRPERLIDLKDVFNDADALIFLGDGEYDLDAVSPYITTRIVAVSGNNDYFSLLPKTRVERFAGTGFLLTHGHGLGVQSGRLSLELKARENGCKFALYGHTHSPLIEISHGITLLCPGSLSYPRGGTHCSYAVIEGDENGFSGKIVFI